MLADNQRTSGTNFPFDATIHPNGSVKTHDAFKVDASTQKREILVQLVSLWIPFFHCPHDALLCFSRSSPGCDTKMYCYILLLTYTVLRPDYPLTRFTPVGVIMPTECNEV